MCTRTGSIAPRPRPSSWALASLLAFLAVLGAGVAAHAAAKVFPAVNIPVGIEPAFVAIADPNADGRPELVVANHASRSVSVLLCSGGGTFAAGATIHVGALPTWVAVGDLDGDGRADLAVANNDSQTISILLGRGDGTFSPGVDYAKPGRPTSIAIADLEGDGRADLAVANTMRTAPAG